VLDGDAIAAQQDLKALDAKAELESLGSFLGDTGDLAAAGVRVVHGGPDFTAATLVDESVLERLEGISELAPLHNPPALAAIRDLRKLRPALPVVACFDTAFHASLAPVAFTYAVPKPWREWGVRRYGFHGLSHAYASRKAAERTGASRIVTCHLGAGASLAAVRGGACVDTTMGFTPMEGLVMATRSGSVDPGAILWAQRRHGLDAAAVERALDREAGLLGLAGSADMKQVLEARAAGDRDAELAVNVYVHRLRSAIASMAAALSGIDALVFTGGVGEHSAEVRARGVYGLDFLGLAVDEGLNAAAGPEDREITGSGARARVLVIQAREDLEIARQTRAVLERRPAQASDR
jgi:acetate kinase